MVTINDFIIKPSHLPNQLFEISNKTALSGQDSFDDRLDEFKKVIIVEAYNKHKSSRKVAKELKISQSKAARLVKQYLGEEIDLSD